MDNFLSNMNLGGTANGIISTPVLAGLIAAGLALLGWHRIADESIFRLYQKERLTNRSRELELGKLKGEDLGARVSNAFVTDQKSLRTSKQLLQIIAALSSSFIITLMLTTSLQISLAISLLFTGLPFILAKRKSEKFRVERDQAWPVAIDEIVASLQAGLSITESVTALAEQGPPQLQATFRRVREGLSGGEDIEKLLRIEMQILDSSTADQTLSTLLFAKQFGGREVISTLRMLSTFLREEIKVREEIDTRFGWVRNSAVLGAVAPWLLLALLSTQRSTVEAYQTTAGVSILSLGVIFTAIAFLWMERVSRMPTPPRPLRPVLSR
ncbi:MAG: hypothetical protein FGM63_04700 [Candidatus Nanopelagicaceae bacterium]|nr:hypothetical protein [Candidatus Nanopelagicaceae bacterium]